MYYSNYYIWFLTLILCWSAYKDTDVTFDSYIIQGYSLEFHTSPTGKIEALADFYSYSSSVQEAG